MCGRYTLAAPSPAEIRARFPVGESLEIRRRFNVAPGDDVLAVTTDRSGEARGEQLRWGLVPSWSETPNTGLKLINARVETVAERSTFRAAMQRFRCLIIADGFYEWRPAVGAAEPKQPFHITRVDGEAFAFAGLWSVWRGTTAAAEQEQEQTIRSCTILTAPANSAIAPLHDRMPVILPHGTENDWLDLSTPADRLSALLRGLPASDTALTPVGPAVNDARYDGPECLEPPPRGVQEALF